MYLPSRPLEASCLTRCQLSAEGVMAAFAITWDLSTGVYWFFAQIHNFIGIGLVWQFEAYALVIGSCLIALALKTVPMEAERLGTLSPEREEREELLSMTTSLQAEEMAKAKKKAKAEGGAWPWKQLLSVPLIVFTLALSFQMLQVSFFMSTVNEQTEWVNSSGQGIFGILHPPWYDSCLSSTA